MITGYAGPDGSIRAMASGEREEVLIVSIDREDIIRQRKEIPYFDDLREDLYQEEREKP